MEPQVKYFKIDGRFLQALHEFVINRPYKEVAYLVAGFNEITELIGEGPLEQTAPLTIVPSEGSAQC